MLNPVPVLLNFRDPLSSLLCLVTGLIGLFPVPKLPRRISENECIRAAVPPVAAMKPGGRSVSSSLSEAERRRLVAVEASEAVVDERAGGGKLGFEAGLGEEGESFVGGGGPPSSC